MVAPGCYKTCLAKLRVAFVWAYYIFWFLFCWIFFVCLFVLFLGFFCQGNIRQEFILLSASLWQILFVCFMIFITGWFGNYPNKFSLLFLPNKRTLKLKIAVFSQEHLCVIRNLYLAQERTVFFQIQKFINGKKSIPVNIKVQQHL